MSERRAPRLLIEVLFLAALAAALTFADLRAIEVAGFMLAGWILVAIFEWGAQHNRPHYGSGLPPRWTVPEVSLPPPRPLEQFSVGYPAPEAGDEPTWIATPAMLADWPVAAAETPVEEQTHAHDVLAAELAVALVDTESDLVSEPEPEPSAEPDPEPELDLEEVEGDAAAPVAPVSGSGLERHRIDPLAEPAPKGRRFGRAKPEPAGVAYVSARPRVRSLPRRTQGEE
jgi:hypothetical protein